MRARVCVLGGGVAVCAGQDAKQPGYIIARALIMYDSHGVDAAAKMIVDMILKRLIVGVVNIKEFVGSFLENFFHLLKVWPLLHFNIQLKRNIHPNI